MMHHVYMLPAHHLLKGSVADTGSVSPIHMHPTDLPSHSTGCSAHSLGPLPFCTDTGLTVATDFTHAVRVGYKAPATKLAVWSQNNSSVFALQVTAREAGNALSRSMLGVRALKQHLRWAHAMHAFTCKSWLVMCKGCFGCAMSNTSSLTSSTLSSGYSPHSTHIL